MSSELGSFLTAVYNADCDAVRAALAVNADLAVLASSGPERDVFDRDVSAIHLAAFRGDVNLMRILLEHNADVNSQGEAGTPLFQALVAGQADAAFWLLDQGVNVNYQHPNGETALHIAAYVGNADLVSALIGQQAQINATTTTGPTDTIPGSPPVMGETPLHLAAAYGHMHVVRTLLAAGADPSIRDITGATAAHWAGRYHQEQVRRVLHAAEAV